MLSCYKLNIVVATANFVESSCHFTSGVLFSLEGNIKPQCASSIALYIFLKN